MLCAELEELEAKFDDIITALETPNLTPKEQSALLQARDQLSRAINDHQASGHGGRPCCEE